MVYGAMQSCKPVRQAGVGALQVVLRAQIGVIGKEMHIRDLDDEHGAVKKFATAPGRTGAGLRVPAPARGTRVFELRFDARHRRRRRITYDRTSNVPAVSMRLQQCPVCAGITLMGYAKKVRGVRCQNTLEAGRH